MYTNISADCLLIFKHDLNLGTGSYIIFLSTSIHSVPQKIDHLIVVHVFINNLRWMMNRTETR